MSVLVTGGAGYIGSHTVIELIKEGYEPVIVDNFSNSHEGVIQILEDITQTTIKYYNADILDQERLREIFKENDFESVIHFAAYKAVGESVQKPLKYYHNNIVGTLSLLEVMSEFDVKNIVFSSSATVYGMDYPSPLKETMLTGRPTNPYGYTKIAMEQILTDMVVSDKEWNVTILRYFNPIGAHESGRIGENPSGIPNNLMPYITQVAIGKRPYLSVFGNDYDTPDGTGVRDYIHVVDLAMGHVKALQQLTSNGGVKIYNLGTGKGYSVLDLVETFKRVNNVDIPYKIEDRRAGDVATCYADPEKAYRELNWCTERNLEQMCQDSWRWQTKNPNGFQTL